jgi:GNAT superfamily N-acetyltransferase
VSGSIGAVLDRQVWNMLNGRLAHLALGAGDALRLDARYGPFAAARDPSEAAQAALGRIVHEYGGEAWLVEPEEWPAPRGTKVLRTLHLLQMIADDPPVSGLAADPQIVELGEDDAAAMAAIAHATEPGPWRELTHRYTRCVGIRNGSGLAAMAGQRMLPAPGLAEVSAVCTWPEFRGQGMASRLIRHVMARMRGEGEIPYLQSYAGNKGAIALYKSLGFRPRRSMVVTVLAAA